MTRLRTHFLVKSNCRVYVYFQIANAPPCPPSKTCSTSHFVSRAIRYTRFCQLIDNMFRQSTVSDNGSVEKLRRKTRSVFAFAKFVLFPFTQAVFFTFLYRKDLIYFLQNKGCSYELFSDIISFLALANFNLRLF